MLSLLILISQIFAEEIPPQEPQQYLEIGKSYQGIIHPRESNHSLFIFSVPDLTNSSDLVIMVKSFNPLADPNVYISRNNTNPQSVQDSDVLACEAKGTDICVLTKSQVIPGELLYLAVVSRFPCRFSIRIDQDQELLLTPNDFLMFKMNSTTESKVILFDVGKLEEKISEIEIIFETFNIDQLEEPFHAYMNQEIKGIPSNEEYDYMAKDLRDTQVIEINKIIPNQKYFILVEAPQGAIIQVSTQLNSQIKQLSVYEEKYQVVEQGDYDFYVVDLEQYMIDINQNNIEIYLTPFQGYASLYVNPNEQTLLLQNYKWSEQDRLGESIVISKEDLDNSNIGYLKSLYIAVYGEVLCTYQIKVMPIYRIEQNITEFISPSIQYSRKIKKNDFLKLQISEGRMTDFTLMINFKKKLGNYNYIITNCTDWSSECPQLSWDWVKNQTQFEEMPYHIFLYSKTLKLDNIRVHCQGSTICYWQLLVYLDEQEEIDEGKVVVSYHIMEDQLYLQENTPHKSYVDKENFNYYKFVIQENDQIHRISFIVTPITGDLTLFMSRNKKYPNKDNCEKQSQNNTINMGGRFGEAPSPGTYYLSVFGNTPSKYTITVWAIRSFQDFSQLGKFPWHYIQLYQGDPQEHELQEEEVALYKIDLLNYENLYRNRVQVSLQIDYGEFLIYGFKKPETDVTNYDWKGTQKLTIEGNDDSYPEILYLRIQLKDPKNYGYGRYRIVYSFENELIWLFQDAQHFSFISSGQSQVFIYEFKQNETFIITKQALTYSQSELNWQFNDEYNFDIKYSKSQCSAQLKAKDSYSNWMSSMDHQHIHFYITFSIIANSDLFYSIVITDLKQSEMQLFDNQPLTKTLPLIADYFYLYTRDKEVSIVCNSYFAQVIIYAKFVNSFEETYPAKEGNNYDKVSKHHIYTYQSSIYFSQEEVQNKECDAVCLIKITIFPDDSFISDYNHSPREFTIQYNSDTILLMEGSSQFGQIQNKSIQYYKANVYDTDKNLMILVTPFYFCDINLYVSKDSYPTQGQFEWSSNDYLGDSLIIEAGNQVDQQITGSYIIGVAGDDQCQFAIQYQLGKMQLYNIYPNTPQQLQIRQEETIYLKVVPYYTKQLPLSVFLSSYSDTAVMFIDEIDILNDNFDYLKKDLMQYKYNNVGKGYSDFLKITEQLSESTFILALKAQQVEDIVIQVNYAEQIMYLQKDISYKNYVEADKSVAFHLNTEYQSDITLWIFVKKGIMTAQYRLIDYYSDQNTSNNFIDLQLHNETYLNRYEIKSLNNQVELKIIGQTEAFFQIYFIIGDTALKQIYSIHPDYFYLRSRDSFGFTYSSNFYNLEQQNPEQKTFSITIGLISGYLQLEGKYRKNLPDITVYAKNKDYKLMPLVYQTLDDVVYLEYIECDTDYNIIINSNSQIDQNFYIQVSSFDVRPLIPQLRFMQSEKLHESTYWSISEQLFLGSIFYDFQFCGGLFQVFLSTDIDKLRSGQYDQQIQTNSKRKVQGVIQIDQLYSSQIFLKITPYKYLDQEAQQASYSLKINNFNNQMKIPYEDIHPGDYGALAHYVELNNNELKLLVNFAPLNYTFDITESDFSIDQVEYNLLVQERDEFNEEVFNYCHEPYLGKKVVYTESNKTQEITMSAGLSDFKTGKSKNLVITVLAKVKLSSDYEKLTLEYYYDSKHVRWNNQNLNKSKPYKKYVIGSIIVITFVGLVLLIRFIRRRQGQKYEVNDNQAQLQPGIELNYRGLAD